MGEGWREGMGREIKKQEECRIMEGRRRKWIMEEKGS